ncbi:MAG: Mut7-C RNAse domain-containing protein [Planctomycetes bacterium]|nr:Mut7-C RNAse domain-containing protein [Planctomycetota bacterium]
MNEPHTVRVACDAMCGGVARWLRIFGVDASYSPDIDDGDLVRHALAEQRIVITSDRRLLERRPFADGRLRHVRLPVGLPLEQQVRYVIQVLGVVPDGPRCSACNGELAPRARADVADRVPARSLIWASEFYQCSRCGEVFWRGTHWRRINAMRQAVERDTDERPPAETPPTNRFN